MYAIHTNMNKEKRVSTIIPFALDTQQASENIANSRTSISDKRVRDKDGYTNKWVSNVANKNMPSNNMHEPVLHNLSVVDELTCFTVWDTFMILN